MDVVAEGAPLDGCPVARSQIRRENADGKGVALAGLVLGYSALAVPCLAIAAVGVITLSSSGAASPP